MSITTDWGTHGTKQRSRRGSGSGHGPPLIVLAAIFSALFVVSVVGDGATTGRAHFPSPYDATGTLMAA